MADAKAPSSSQSSFNFKQAISQMVQRNASDLLLKVGRHLRPAGHFKVIVARDDGENNFLEGYRKQFVHLRIENHEGPLTLIDGRPSFSDIELAARIAARYSQGRDAGVVQVSAHHPNGVVEALSVNPMPPHQIPDAWHV